MQYILDRRRRYCCRV